MSSLGRERSVAIWTNRCAGAIHFTPRTEHIIFSRVLQIGPVDFSAIREVANENFPEPDVQKWCQAPSDVRTHGVCLIARFRQNQTMQSRLRVSFQDFERIRILYYLTRLR